RARDARIHAELLGGAVNCGGHRGGGSMTAPNPHGVVRCIRAALSDAGVEPDAMDAINGHLTATGADAREVEAWAEALERPPDRFPVLTATKSMIGHTLGAAGAIEGVAPALGLTGGVGHAALDVPAVAPPRR